MFVPYDQLGLMGPLAREAPSELGIVLVESRWKAARRPYHRQKLALILANLRHFALEQAGRGVAVRHVVTDGPYAAALAPLAAEFGELHMMEAAERELRTDVAELVTAGAIRVLPHEGWLTTPEDFTVACPAAPWRMDAFYRRVRRRTGVLMDDGRPIGGRWSFDADNRRRWRGQPPPPSPPVFTPDDVTAEVADLVARRFASHPGRLDPTALPATAADAERQWQWALHECLPSFGPYEDAMSVHSRGLFHTRVSALLNLHRLLPARLIADVAASDAPLASREGFVRQVLGWREFVRHVHRATDGFRHLPDGTQPPRDETGAAMPSHLDAHHPLPPAFWDTPSGLACLDHVVASVWSDGYGHHITRLMVLSNIATLLDLSPRALTDWFWEAYTDAYDWVVEPNVLGMGTFAAGDVMTTKPYVAGAAYLRRMSDYCDECAFDPAKSCPLTRLYWAFLARHATTLAANPRLQLPLAAVARRPPRERTADAEMFALVRERLTRGERLTP